MFLMCAHLGIITGLTVFVIILYDFDRKRRLDQCYNYKVQKKRAEIKLKETDEFRYRLMAFPISNKIKYIKKFVIREIQKGEEYMVQNNYTKAVEHFANGLSMIDRDHKLINNLSKNVTQEMCIEIKNQVQKIQTMLAKIKMLKS
ncbi:uncharacterized protein LOC126551437 [Aphis gossypii]|uniref:uncharacterized protein LOC126551437 n=1 Tax=Aphis gossypii TaxID=80765 RepID=UPI002158D521|nr:uncharacterized protein LOC126551437 [Aphis gossypii]